MRSIASLFGVLAAALLAAAPAAAQPPGGAVPPGVPPGFDPGGTAGGPEAQRQKMQEMMQANMVRMQAQMAKQFGLKIPAPGVTWGGMLLEPAGAALLDQLDLPAGKGMIVANVDADSPAAQAGLKKNDLLLKVNAQAVSGDAKGLLKDLGADADAAVELVVVRKGKEQTLKGVKLPAAKLAMPALAGMPASAGFPVPPFPPPGFPAAGGFPVPPGGFKANVQGASVTINRKDDQFDASYKKDKLHVTIHGKMEGRKAKAEAITVDDGEVSKKYTQVADVPEAQRPQVSQLLQMVNGQAGGFIPPGILNPPGAPPIPPAPPVPEKN